MNTKILLSAVAIAVATVGFAPLEAQADKPKKIKKAIKKAYKQDHKWHKKAEKRHYKRYHDNDWDHDDWDNDYDDENWGISISPSGGLGFYYSENEGSYGYPYRGYSYPYRSYSSPYYGGYGYGGYYY